MGKLSQAEILGIQKIMTAAVKENSQKL